MRESLPQPGRDAYDRPQQPWTCGRAAEGDPCALGPLDGGVCSAQQCRPVRSLRTLRGIVVRSTVLFAVGAVLMLLGGDWRNQLLAPGPLCSQHAQVLHGAGWENRCSSCHSAAEQSPAAWLTAVVGQRIGPTQSEKCMACHDKSIAPGHSLAAHNMPTDELARMSDNSNSDFTKELACSVCHQEHHGAEHNMRAMDNARCQACHVSEYESFASDHPELGIWPYERRTPIAFSHTTHAGKYFAEKHVEFACQRCHVEDATGAVQLTLDYNNACAECHDADIATSTAGGVPVFVLPTLDVDAFAEVGIPFGDWPEAATGDFDGVLPPIMKLLLAADPAARGAMLQLGMDFEFYDVDPDDPQQVQAAADLANAIRQLLGQLEINQAALVRQAAGEVFLPGQPAAAQVLSGLAPEIVTQAGKQWRMSTDAQNAGAGAAISTQPAGRWFVDNTTLSLRYQPTGHADPVLKAWLDMASAVINPQLRRAILAELTGPNSPGRCASCHSIEEKGTGSFSLNLRLPKSPASRDNVPVPFSSRGEAFAVNWQPHDRRQKPRSFTRFTHAPHLLPIELRDCTACHQIDPQADTTANYTGANPSAFVSDFLPIEKATCASCHNRAAVGDGCTQCHNYHIDWHVD